MIFVSTYVLRLFDNKTLLDNYLNQKYYIILKGYAKITNDVRILFQKTKRNFQMSISPINLSTIVFHSTSISSSFCFASSIKVLKYSETFSLLFLNDKSVHEMPSLARFLSKFLSCKKLLKGNVTDMIIH